MLLVPLSTLLASLNLLEIKEMTNSFNQQERDPITHRFIGLAMKVHSFVGPGLNEEIYHQELARTLQKDGVEHLSKPRRDLIYRGIVADTFEPDLVVEDHFIPELKSLRGKFSPAHMVQAFCYCKFWRLRTSLLVDFGKQSLTWERLVYKSHCAHLPEVNLPEFVRDAAMAVSIVQAVRECLSEIGLGYRQTTWNGLVSAAVQSAGHQVKANPTATILGHTPVELNSLVINNTVAVLITALADKITAIDRAVLQTHLRWLNLRWGIVFHFGKTDADLAFVQPPKKQSAGLPESAGDLKS